MLKLKFLPLSIMVAWATGCGSWSADSHFSYGVWSDDGTQAAFTLNRFESRDNLWRFLASADTRRRDSLQVYISAAQPGSPVQALGPIFPGSNMNQSKLFYMSTAGYVTLSRQIPIKSRQDENGSSFSEFYVEQIALDGTHRRVATKTAVQMLSCDGGSSATSMPAGVVAIPNFDGSLIALLSTDADCQSLQTEVTFLNASDLSVFSGPFNLFQNAPTPMGGVEYAWTPSDQFMMGFWSFGGVSGASASTSGQITSFTGVDMNCFHPSTSSGEWNASGQSLLVSDSERVEIDANTVGPQNRQGCPP